MVTLIQLIKIDDTVAELKWQSRKSEKE